MPFVRAPGDECVCCSLSLGKQAVAIPRPTHLQIFLIYVLYVSRHISFPFRVATSYLSYVFATAFSGSGSLKCGPARIAHLGLDAPSASVFRARHRKKSTLVPVPPRGRFVRVVQASA